MINPLKVNKIPNIFWSIEWYGFTLKPGIDEGATFEIRDSLEQTSFTQKT